MSMCVTTVAIFNNGHHDVAIFNNGRDDVMPTIIVNMHCNNGQLCPILQRVACNDGSVIAAPVPVITVAFCSLLQGPIALVIRICIS